MLPGLMWGGQGISGVKNNIDEILKDLNTRYDENLSSEIFEASRLTDYIIQRFNQL